MTALDFTSEAPVNDHGAQGKAIHAIIMLLGVGLFTVPMGLFASAFRERLDEMHAKKLRPLLRSQDRHTTHGRRVSETAMVLAEDGEHWGQWLSLTPYYPLVIEHSHGKLLI
eukprot:s791_g7.t1